MKSKLARTPTFLDALPQTLAALSARDREILECIWRRREITAGGVYVSLARRVPYPELTEILDRLFRDRLLRRRSDGDAFVYSVVAHPDDLASDAAAELLRRALAEAEAAGLGGRPADGTEASGPCGLKQILETCERRILESVLLVWGGNQRRAAASLGLLPTTLHEKVKRLGVARDPGSNEGEPG